MIDIRLLRPGMRVRVKPLEELRKVPIVASGMHKYAGQVMEVSSVDVRNISLRADEGYIWNAHCFSNIVDLKNCWSKDAVSQLLKGAAYD